MDALSTQSQVGNKRLQGKASKSVETQEELTFADSRLTKKRKNKCMKKTGMKDGQKRLKTN